MNCIKYNYWKGASFIFAIYLFLEIKFIKVSLQSILKLIFQFYYFMIYTNYTKFFCFSTVVADFDLYVLLYTFYPKMIEYPKTLKNKNL